MTQIFGDFTEKISPNIENISLNFSSTSQTTLSQRWQNNGISARFLANYLTTFFPINQAKPDSLKQQKKIKGASGFIVNELLENATKFNDKSSDYPIQIEVFFQVNHISFLVTNSISQFNIKPFQQLINTLLSGDPEKLYFNCLEQEKNEDNCFGLGLLTIIKNYPIKIGWQFKTLSYQTKEVTVVTTMVQLQV